MQFAERIADLELGRRHFPSKTSLPCPGMLIDDRQAYAFGFMMLSIIQKSEAQLGSVMKA